jgi:acyl carrier protein
MTQNSPQIGHTEIDQKSRAVVLKLLPDVTEQDLSEEADLFDLGLDSINAMTLVLNLQQTFNVKFETRDISMENFCTIGDIIRLIQHKQADNVANRATHTERQK